MAGVRSASCGQTQVQTRQKGRSGACHAPPRVGVCGHMPLACSTPREQLPACCRRHATAATRRRRSPCAGLLLHGQTDEQRAERDAERQQSAEMQQQFAAQLRQDPEALAAKWRSVAESATALADGLLAEAPPGEESVPQWMARRFQELGIK